MQENTTYDDGTDSEKIEALLRKNVLVRVFWKLCGLRDFDLNFRELSKNFEPDEVSVIAPYLVTQSDNISLMTGKDSQSTILEDYEKLRKAIERVRKSDLTEFSSSKNRDKIHITLKSRDKVTFLMEKFLTKLGNTFGVRTIDLSLETTSKSFWFLGYNQLKNRFKIGIVLVLEMNNDRLERIIKEIKSDYINAYVVLVPTSNKTFRGPLESGPILNSSLSKYQEQQLRERLYYPYSLDKIFDFDSGKGQITCKYPLSKVIKEINENYLDHTLLQEGIYVAKKEHYYFKKIHEKLWQIRFEGGAELQLGKVSGLNIILYILRNPTKIIKYEDILKDVDCVNPEEYDEGRTDPFNKGKNTTDKKPDENIYDEKKKYYNKKNSVYVDDAVVEDLLNTYENRINEINELLEDILVPLKEKEKLEKEKNDIIKFLDENFYGRKPRKTSNAMTKQKKRIRTYITRAIEKIAIEELNAKYHTKLKKIERYKITKEDTPLAFHLKECINTKDSIRYTKSPDIDWHFS